MITEEQVIQKEMLQKYLHNQLSPEDKADFEVFLLEHPNWQVKAELDWALQQMLPAIKHTHPSWWTQLFRSPGKTSLSALVAVALVICLLPHLSPDAHQSVASSQVFYLQNMRSVQFHPAFSVDSTEAPVALVVDTLFSEPGERYSLQLYRSDSENRLAQLTVKSSPQGEAVLMIPGALLFPADYELRIFAQSGQLLHSYPFSVDKERE